MRQLKIKRGIAILITTVVLVVGVAYIVASQRDNMNPSVTQIDQGQVTQNIPQVIEQSDENKTKQSSSQTAQLPAQSVEDATSSTVSDDSQNIVVFSGSVERILANDSEGGVYEFRVRYDGNSAPVEDANKIVRVKTGPTMRLVPGTAYTVRAYYIPEEKIYYIYETHGFMQLDI